MPVTIYHNPRCNTSRKTLALLRDKGVEPEIVEYLKTPYTAAQLKTLLGQLKLPAKAIVRKKEAAAAGVDPAKLSEDQLIAAMAKNPIIVERPIVVSGGKAALGRPPEARYRKNDGATPRLQRVLDALDPSPALIRNAKYDVVAWNRAATVMLVDYGSLPPEQRNILRFIFLDPRARAAQYDWESVARFVLGAFRVDAARAGAAAEIEPLVDELCRLSPEFKAMWRDNDVPSHHGEGVKHIRHPVLGPLAFEFSTFAVDGRTDLAMVVYNPATPEDADRIKSLLA